nr:aspartate/glutamate racemase family protein [Maliibacterium massiliense]
MSKQKHVCVLQTGAANREDVLALFAKHAPDVRVTFVMDDALIQDVKAAGAPTPSVKRRMCQYAIAAQDQGADLILNMCSSVSEVADLYAQLLDIPVVKIDLPMAEEALRHGARIALVATVATTVGPSRRLIERTAQAQGKRADVQVCLADGALDRLLAGDVAGHNAMLRDMIVALDGKCDAIVLAQASMMAILPEVAQVRTPVLASIPLAIPYVAQLLQGM